jgi:hypothetical protein
MGAIEENLGKQLGIGRELWYSIVLRDCPRVSRRNKWQTSSSRKIQRFVLSFAASVSEAQAEIVNKLSIKRYAET